MKTKIHGAVAMLLFIAAFLAGGYAVFNASVFYGILYSAAILIFFTVIPAIYCVKCPCRDNCVHIILGPISKLIKPIPDKSAYTVTDVVVTLVVAVEAVIFPQPWLFKYTGLLIFYWAAVGLAAVEIMLFVCHGCANEKCPMKKSFLKK